jgi:hypothetical protein
MKKQAGFLVMAAVVMIVFFGLLSALIVHLYISTISSKSNLQSAIQADYLAHSALEDGLLQLRLPNLSSRQACSSLSLIKTLNNGTYNASAAIDALHALNPKLASSTLSSLTPSAITLGNSSVFAPSGRVMIGREAIDYQRNNTTLNQLEGITRAVDGTEFLSHQVTDSVSQFQCTLVGSSVAVGNSAESYLTIDAQLPLVLTAGNVATTWNAPIELEWRSTTNSRVQRGISMLNYNEGWAVGDRQGNILGIARWDLSANAWNQQAVNLGIQETLNAVSAVSTQEAWAVGTRDGGNYTLLRWLGGAFTNWCIVTSSPSCGGKSISSSAPNNRKDLYAINMIDTNNNGVANFGFAAGGRGNDGRILIYNGTTWGDSSISASQVGRVYGLKIIKNGTSSPIQAWAVSRRSTNSNHGRILMWNGSSWQLALAVNRRMLAIDMVDTTGDGQANYGWAVGRSGRAYYYNGSTFTQYAALGNRHLNAVTIINQNDVWVVDTRGNRWHFDGTSWSQQNTGFSTNQNLYAVASISANSQPQSAWRQIEKP